MTHHPKPEPITPKQAELARDTDRVYWQTVERLNEFLSTRALGPNNTKWYGVDGMSSELIDRLLTAYREAGWAVERLYDNVKHSFMLVFWAVLDVV